MEKTIKISEDLHYRIKVYCVENKIKMNNWCEVTLLSELIKLINKNVTN